MRSVPFTRHARERGESARCAARHLSGRALLAGDQQALLGRQGLRAHGLAVRGVARGLGRRVRAAEPLLHLGHEHLRRPSPVLDRAHASRSARGTHAGRPDGRASGSERTLGRPSASTG